MDPVSTTIVSALALGAVAGVKKVGETAFVDAYNGLKKLIAATYSHAADLLESITGLEKKPDSDARRGTVAEELKLAGALDNAELVAAAEAVVAAAEKEGLTPSIGLDWSDVKAARLKVGQIRARAGAVGFRAARMEVTGEVEIGNIEVGNSSGK